MKAFIWRLQYVYYMLRLAPGFPFSVAYDFARESQKLYGPEDWPKVHPADAVMAEMEYWDNDHE